MKAYLNINGFTKMIDIDRDYPVIKIPIYETIDLFVEPEKPITSDSNLINVLEFSFLKNGELRGGREIIINYTWDGMLPKRSV